MSTTTAQRVTCDIQGPRNDFGKPRLVATIVPDGLQVWCKYCRAPHLISREQCINAWERGEAVLQCEEAHINCS